jgi:predicted dithiol-disulfide oxidoreductase (DUF899 family)
MEPTTATFDEWITAIASVDGKRKEPKSERCSTAFKGDKAMNTNVVSHTEWLAARKELLNKEKEMSRLRDELTRQRRELPWEAVEKQYVFDGPQGKESLADLFSGRSQLLVYHFMFGPEWEQGCPSCSWVADNIDPNVVHLAQRDVTMVLVSRAPYARIEAFQKRMGWKVKWLSSFANDFNYDYHVSFRDGEDAGRRYYNFGINAFPQAEAPGVSVFARDGSGKVFHTYSVYARGLEPLLGGYHLLDMVPKGRNEDGKGMSWLRHHDRYASGPVAIASAQPAAMKIAK